MAPLQRAAVLSFDDGPDPDGTPPVLAALAKNGARATFFLLGRHVAEWPDLARRIEGEGHEIALHGMEHRRHDLLSPAEAESELKAGIEAIEAATGKRPIWYRPPFGASSPMLATTCRELDLRLAYWSAWGQDWEESTPERIASLVERDLGPGAIVLLHDSARYAQRAEAMATADSIPLTAGVADASGLDLVTLGTAVGDGD
jgi:peptidoglycan/xylan/chitin deacetylase (PgdA/CDA1 family)